MGQSYYYFVASLPILHFEGKAPMSLVEFLEDCHRLLSPHDYRDVQLALRGQGSHIIPRNDVLKEWLEFDRCFRNEIAWFRALELDKDPEQYLRGDRYVESYLVDVVIEASKASDPLTAEKIIDRTRWQRMSDLEQGQMFNLEYLIIYGLKLRMLERYQEIHSDQGAKMLKKYQELELPEFEYA